MPYEEKGLTDHEAKVLLSQVGPNALPENPPPTDLEILLSQLKSPLVYILFAAGIVTVVLGDFKDSAIIFFAVLINTVFGFFQERKANQALAALKKLINQEAEIIRNGKIIKVDARDLVPRDLLIIRQGNKIAADGELIQVNRLFINESSLTGESVPLEKKKGHEIFMGTIVTSGQGLVRITKTGSLTQMGKIAQSVQDFSFDTPLRRQVSKFSNQLVLLVIVLVIFVILLGLARGREFIEIFTTAVALAVSAIPEGLLVALTVVLAIGMQRILKRKGLVRNLVSAETLGGVTTICTDKTGTLTQGKMQVVDVVGHKKALAEQVLVSNDLDDPMVVSAFDWAKGEVSAYKDLIDSNKRLDSIPFSSEERFFTSLHHGKTKNTLFVSGAPEYLLSWSTLSKKEREEYMAKINELTKSGKRLVAYGKKFVSKDKVTLSSNDVKSKLEFIGILAFFDPVRVGVKESLQKAKAAGIKLIVITGDYTETATHVLQELDIDIKEKHTMIGSELAKLSKEELTLFLQSRGEEVILFARTTPEQKLKIVESLQSLNEVVGMMGDGVNDAPALSRADVGIVVGDATDVAKESSDLVLLDSSFETIVAAVEEGRGIFDNIRRVILYLMSSAFAEIAAVVISLIIGLPLPITAAQILWINIVSDGLPNIALTIDPKGENIMARAPRDPREMLVAPWMKYLIFIVSITGGLLTIGVFMYTWTNYGNLEHSRSIAFAVLGINSLIYVFSTRNLGDPIWKGNIFRNKWLVVAVLAGIFLQVLPFFWGPLGSYFEVVSLGPIAWGAVFAIAFMQLSLIELSKEVFKTKLR